MLFNFLFKPPLNHQTISNKFRRPMGSGKLVLSKPKKKSEYRVEYYFKKNEIIDNNMFHKAYITEFDEKDEFYVIWDTKFLKAGGAQRYHFKMTEKGAKLLKVDCVKNY